MRILFISNNSHLYGANRSMMTVIEYLHSKGNVVKLILPSEGEICTELQEKGIDYEIMKMFTQLYYYKLLIKYLSLPLLDAITFMKLSALKNIAKAFNPDLIYSNTSAEMVGIKVAKSLNVKHISHIREFMDLDYGAKYIFGRKAKMNYINKSDGVIYVSKSVANHVNMGKPLQDWQKVIYNGIKTIDWLYEEKKLADELNLGIVGIFDPAKGQILAISMMPNILKLYPNAKLHVWGDKEGAYKKSLYKMVEDLHLADNVVFHGFEKSSMKIYNDMHVLLMCSRCEGFGRVTIEAMQRAIPVLGYNRGGTAELVKDGFNGYLFKTPEECVGGLQKLLASEETFNQIRKQAYEDSREHYSVETYCKNVEIFINKIMAQ